MSKYISTALKEEVKRSHYTYESLARELGLSTKQNMNFYLNHKDDAEWTYNDIKRFCRALGVNHILFLQDVDRKSRLG
jgi:hypothetical protein